MKKRTKIVFITSVLVCYVIGTFLGFKHLNSQTVTRYYCIESAGPKTYQPDEDCDRVCLKWEPKLETRKMEAFYTYGLIGAFLGGWLSVFYITYVLKE